MQPFTPHLSEELWSLLDMEGMAVNQKWPKKQGKATIINIKMPIQINGKTKHVIDIKSGLEKNELEKIALAQPRIIKIIDGNKIKKIIYVENKIINFVI